jgi:hypothetical protein
VSSRNEYPPRSPEGLMRGGHTRPIGSTTWGCSADLLKVPNAPNRSAPYQVIGSHGPAPARRLQPGASEGNPAGFPPSAGMKGRR